jgi:hypothetical protein
MSRTRIPTLVLEPHHAGVEDGTESGKSRKAGEQL